MSSLRDVAKKARVAISTASLALNNRSRVSEDTRNRVLHAAKELAYYPHSLARGLKSRRTETVGLFMKHFGGPVYNELVQGVQQALAKAGYDMIVCFSSDRVLKGRQIDGAVVLDPYIADDTLRIIGERGLPVAVMDREPHAPGLYAVLLDNAAGVNALAAHVSGAGFRDVVFVGGPTASYDGERRRQGILRALRREGVPADVPCLVTDFTVAGGAAAVREYLGGHAPPRVFVCANDETAIGAMEVLAEIGRPVPDGTAVTGFDDIQLARYVTPALTTVRVPRYRWGELAAQVVLTALSGGTPRRVTKVPVELVVRASTTGARPARPSSPTGARPGSAASARPPAARPPSSPTGARPGSAASARPPAARPPSSRAGP
jgi:LacI family transcriptional regulator